MVRVRSPAARVARGDRARRLGHLRSLPAGCVHLQVPSELAARTKVQVVILQNHQRCNRLSGAAHHLAGSGIAASRPLLPKDTSDQLRRDSRAAARARHVWADLIDDDPEIHLDNQENVAAAHECAPLFFSEASTQTEFRLLPADEWAPAYENQRELLPMNLPFQAASEWSPTAVALRHRVDALEKIPEALASDVLEGHMSSSDAHSHARNRKLLEIADDVIRKVFDALKVEFDKRVSKCMGATDSLRTRVDDLQTLFHGLLSKNLQQPQEPEAHQPRTHQPQEQEQPQGPAQKYEPPQRHEAQQKRPDWRPPTPPPAPHEAETSSSTSPADFLDPPLFEPFGWKVYARTTGLNDKRFDKLPRVLLGSRLDSGRFPVCLANAPGSKLLLLPRSLEMHTPITTDRCALCNAGLDYFAFPPVPVRGQLIK